jgi:tetratricopeptide (TPR) repeat protein
MGGNTMNKNDINEMKQYITMLFKAKELINLSTDSKEEHRKNLKQAIDVYSESLKYNEDNIEVLVTIAHCYMELEHVTQGETERRVCLENAIDWTKKAIKKAPEKSHLHALLGILYHIAHLDYQATADEYRIAIAQNPPDASIYASAAFILYGPPESPVTLQEAIGWLESAVKLAPDNPEYLASLGRLYNKAGRNQDALRTWVAALSCHQPLLAGKLQEIKNSLGIE